MKELCVFIATGQLLLLITCVQTQGQPCTNGWFGYPSCKYKCHCASNSQCDDKGNCSGGCDKGWFGPACQYVDLVALNSTNNMPDWLYDSNDSTCNTDIQNVIIELTSAFPITWIRLIVNKNDWWDTSQVSLQFKNSSGSGNIACTNQRQYTPTKQTLDIYCDLQETFQQVIVQGSGVQSLCSVYVSGGRNVALKQFTSQSSDLDTKHTSSLAVDGNTEKIVDDYCTLTSEQQDASPTWMVNFSFPVQINRYVLYNRRESVGAGKTECCPERLKSFILTSFNETNSPVFNYTEPDQVLDVYTVISAGDISPLHKVSIRATAKVDYYWKTYPNPILTLCEVEMYGDQGQSLDVYRGILAGDISPIESVSIFATVVVQFGTSTFTNPILTLCEVEMFGDSFCDTPKYGRECENPCNCYNNEKCFISTGGCPNGCAEGYYGEACSQACPSGLYGINCRNVCNANCVEGKCDSTNGTCTACITGKTGPMCNENCSSGCLGSCDKMTNECQDCVVGFYGSTCSLKCNINCGGNGSCNQTTGDCSHGCDAGFNGSKCEIQLAQTTGPGEESPPVAAIVVPIVAALVIALLIALGVILWRRKIQGKESNNYTRSESKQEFSQSKANVLANVKTSIETPITEEGTVSSSLYETISEYEDTQNIETTETEPAMKIDEMKKVNPPVDPEASGNKRKQFQLPDTRHDSDKQNGAYYNILTDLSATAIDVEKLDVFIDSHKRVFFQMQFNKIPTNTNASITIAQSPENRIKNRYKTLCAYDHSRVHLIENTAKNHGDYINASYVEGYKNEERFIASQGPTLGILEDFVRMLWEQDIQRVVMLTNLIEGEMVICERYWPEVGEIEIGEITIKLKTTQVFADYTIRKLQLLKTDESTKTLTHFHFTSWPDICVPTTPWGLVDFEQRVARNSNNKSIVVHCSTGVGRSGTFIALRNVIKEAEDTGYMDFFTTVQKLRVDRMNMVQNAEEYEFLHKAAQVALVCRKTTVTSSNISDRIKALENISMKKGQTNLEKEFKTICNICGDKAESLDDILNVFQNSQALVNKHKNQLSNILPKDPYRVILSCESKELEDYINAVFVPSFVKHDQQILTQLPLPTTVTDFWRMVTQYQVKLIVAFDTDPKQNDLKLGEYLPVEENQKAESLHLNIEAGPVSRGNFWEERQVLISNDDESKVAMSAYKNLDDEHRITHLKCTKEDLNTSELLALAKEIRAKRPIDDCRVVYMCRNGADCSGLVCALVLLLDRIDNDHCLTVPLVVGAIKAVRLEVIPTLAQYKTLYQALKLYNEMSNDYCNSEEEATKKLGVANTAFWKA